MKNQIGNTKIPLEAQTHQAISPKTRNQRKQATTYPPYSYPPFLQNPARVQSRKGISPKSEKANIPPNPGRGSIPQGH
jgi:hypothetical protein